MIRHNLQEGKCTCGIFSDVDHERVSRRLNAWLGGHPAECLCARLHRNRVWAWPLILVINAGFSVVYREPWGHCSRIHERERRRRVGLPPRVVAVPDVPPFIEAARREGLL